MNPTTKRSRQGPTTPTPAPPVDARARSFCSPEGPEVFYPVAHTGDVWRPDPFDVESIHAEAREVFRGLVARAGTTPRPTSGRILLIKGESGSGKTHLMRAFRTWAHEGGRGYCGYMQMTAAAEDYGRYVLNNLMDSLDKAYHHPHGETTGLARLSSAVAESSRFVSAGRLAQLREDDLDAKCLGRLVDALADQIVEDERFNDVDIDLIRALLYLQRNDRRIKVRISKYLRCEELSPADSLALGDLAPRAYPGAAERVVALLGRLMGSVESVPLILCLDQIEAIKEHGDAKVRFPRAMASVCNFADQVPSSVVVISCLDDMYDELRDHLATPARFRIEKDPAPILLSARREVPEVAELIARRLEVLYEAQGVEIDPADPTYPVAADELPKLAGLPTRYILDWCRQFREDCTAAGWIVAGPAGSGSATPHDHIPDTIPLEQLWNEERSRPGIPIPVDEVGLAGMLARAIARCSDEVGGGRHFSAEADDSMVAVERHDPDQSVTRLLVAICEKATQGGGLGRQIAAVEKRTGSSTPAVTPVLARSTDFPKNPKAEVSKQIGQLVARGGRRVVVEDSDWRAIRAFLDFREVHRANPAFSAWLVAEKPLSRLESLRKILALDDLAAAPSSGRPIEPETVAPALREPEPRSPGKEPADPAPIRVGVTTGLRTSPVTVAPEELVTHAAFLGASGSGKTTVALGIIEHLLGRGIPAILVDRKGDLGRYADPGAWIGPAADPEAEGRRALLGDRLEVALFTPGAAEGRPLSIAAIPPGLGAMKSAERAKTARFAASALAGMMNYKAGGADEARTVILANAMDLISQARPDGAVTLRELIEFIAEADPALVNAIGRIDTKHFAKLVENLETILYSRSELLTARGEPMDIESLLGLGPHARPGKTRLSVISTKFLGANQDIQFWVAQFLMELARWTSRSPSKGLQAVVLFDEADLYLPAVGKPATKEPMEGLLKRARSAGLGLMLATQSPGDFDYKCRENIRAWFLGRIKETNAINKMKPMLGEARGVDLASRLPGQSRGEFHLLRDGQATALRADRNLIPAEQMPEADILALARRTREGT